ncbi:ATP-binding protein [Thalassotalea sediminis]|uniref:ATP-binding protein n=1 Tax=Thalassotalea sediminis TaxID=1759089 RepID=UPI002572BEAB|nr:ATP-binding protein [Thalassotalea sediminis]
MKRLFISIIFAVFGSLFLIGWGLDMLIEKNATNEEQPEIKIYQQLIEGVAQELDLVAEQKINTKLAKIAQHYALTVSIEETAAIALPEPLFSQLSEPGGLLLASEQQAYLLKRLANTPQFLVKLQIPFEQEENLRLNALFTAILYLGVGSIIVLWLLPLARRLYLLTNAAERIGKGEQNVRVNLSRFSYIYPLESRFNQMAAQIEKLMADNKLLARSLSHDIRTPMSCLRFGMDAALDSDSIDKKNSYLKRMDIELTRMEDMTSAFLSYASMERQGIHLKFEPINAKAFVDRICSEFQTLAQQHKVSLTCKNMTNDAVINADQYWLNRALQNLLTNAIHYAKTQVLMSTTVVQKKLQIVIEDDGKGIEKEKFTVIFDPFVKLDVDRSREQGHFGLGLAICHKVAHWHKGDISAGFSTNLHGAKFTLAIPLTH